MIAKGERYRVINDNCGYFKMGDIVIPLENSDVPYCVYEEYYEEGKDITAYESDKYNPLKDSELEKIESEDMFQLGYNKAIDDIKEKLMQNGFIYTQHALDVFNEIAEQLKAGGKE